MNIRNKYGTTSHGAISTNRNYGDDGRSEVMVDNAGNIYVASCSQSSDFVTANAIQTKNNGGTNGQDGVVIKVDAAISTVLFATYLGGSGDDAAFVIDINPLTNNIYVGGATASSDFPGNTTNVIYPSYQGGVCDGFVTVLSNDGSQFINTSYFGTSGTDVVYGLKFDKFGYPYIMGTSTNNLPVVNSPWNTTDAVGKNQAATNQFITKLSQDLSTIIYSANFGTTFATAPNISPTAFLVDRCENVYVSGWGGKGNSGDEFPSAGTTGLSVTSNPQPIQSTTDGSDFYFFVLEKNAQSQLYGSFFGQKDNINTYPDHVDGGTSRFDKNGIIYQAACANCGGGATFPTTPGVWSTVNQALATRSGAECNLAAIKIAFNLAGLASGVQASIRGIVRDTSGCVPLSVAFKDTVGLAKTYIWNFGDGTPDVTTTINSTSHLYSNIGIFNVRLVAVDSNSCNISDTSYTTIRVRNDDATLAMNAFKIPPCQSLTFEFDNTSSGPSNKPFKSKSFQLFFGDGSSSFLGSPQSVQHTYAATGTYNARLVLVDTNYCNYPDSITQQIRLAPNVSAQFLTPSVGCAPYTAIIKNTSVGGAKFNWNFGDGTSSTQSNPPNHLYSNPGTYTIKLVVTDTATCNKADSTTLTLIVSGKPTSLNTYSPKPPQENTAVTFTNTSIGGSTYTWLFGDGDSTITTDVTQTVSHIYGATQTFNACLITTNSSGCSDTLCQNIQAKVVPVYGVPKSFTPNGDGVNDKIYVRGYGIAKMEWQIYNRWGTLVFVSSSPSNGWDGKYNGQLQPQDVYHYTLTIEFSDKSKVTDSGDITLLR